MEPEARLQEPTARVASCHSAMHFTVSPWLHHWSLGLLPTVRGGQELLLPQNTGVSSQRALKTGPGT